MNKFVWLLVGLVSTPSAGLAYCSEPSGRSTIPDPPGSYLRPNVPYCLSGYEYSGEHTCEQWELDSFVNDVNDYIEKLNEFADDSIDYADDAREFAEAAIDYARCEADEVKEILE